MRLRDSSLLMLTLLTVSLPAQASPWYPIDTGRLWSYIGAFGSTVTVLAQETFAGSLVQTFQWDSGARNHFSQDELGRVLEHGVTQPDGSYFVFQPPVVRMDADLTPGHTWQTIFNAVLYDAQGIEIRRVQAHSIFRVVAFRSVTVAAGTFPAAEILRTEDTGLFPEPSVFRETYAEGVGCILRIDDASNLILLELEGYGTNGVPTAASSWSALKSRFGN